MKKVLFLSLILLALVIVIIGIFRSLIPAPVIWDGTADTDWYSEEETEFTINTAEQLGGLADLVNMGNDFFGKTVRLGANIMLNDTANWQSWENKPPVNEWVPIGGFQGIFDGNGFVISGVYINNPDYGSQGLFMYVEYGAVIKNLGVTASYIKGGTFVGGLVGSASESVINNSYFVGTVIGGTVGGLIGHSFDSEISNSYSIGTVTGEGAGGLVGWKDARWDAVLLIGDEDKRWLDWLDSNKSNRGVINNSYFAGTSSGGLIGDYSYGTIINSYYNKETDSQEGIGGIGKTTAEMQSKEFVDDLNLAASFSKMNAWIYSKGNYPTLSNQVIEADIDSFFASGDGTEMNPYIINTKKQLENFSKLVNFGMNFSNKYLKLGAHIAFNDTANWQNWANEPPANEWIPIGKSHYLFETMFEGTFDGNGFTISGIYVNSQSDYQGLFAKSNGTVKNLGVTASYVKGKSDIGGLAGINNGEIIKSYYVGYVVGYEKSDYSESHWVGGLAGSNSGTISNSYSAGTVNGDWQVGGFVGFNVGIIDNSYSTLAVTGEFDIGGLVGWNLGTINNSYSIGAVTATGRKLDIGGLVGKNRGTISNSYSIGVVTGTDKTGGLVGLNDRFSDKCSKIINCYYNKQVSDQKGIGFDSNSEYLGRGSCVNEGDVKGKTTKEMKQKETFKGWDFDSIWKIDARVNDGYPYL
ncbi:MAG: hypothetical protein LBH25_13145 [Fibromonadaceae bacterium]|jgi:hypothetical protein|nr:hypothetical protein [Fibromonadaceae bacterium]